MTFKQWFLEEAKEKGKPDLRKSASCYEDSEEHIVYARLSNSVKGFNFITLSKSIVEKTKEDKSALAKADVVFDPDYGWKAQLPDSTEKSDLDFEW